MNTNIGWLGMSGAGQFEPREKSITIGKVIFGLSFVLPYLVYYASPETFDTIMIYAPFWVLQQRGNLVVGGPSPMALIMFQFWIPYVLIGYQARRYADGRCSSERSYILSVMLITTFAILMALPLSFMPSGSLGYGDIYVPYIPIPIIPVLALVSTRALRPIKVEVPWSEALDTSEQEPDTKTKSFLAE